MKRKLLIVFLSFLLVIGSSSYVRASDDYLVEKYLTLSNQASGENAYNTVKILTSDEFEGRLSGTEGSSKAARWISDQMKQIGLKPGIIKENNNKCKYRL